MRKKTAVKQKDKSTVTYDLQNQVQVAPAPQPIRDKTRPFTTDFQVSPEGFMHFSFAFHGFQ